MKPIVNGLWLVAIVLAWAGGTGCDRKTPPPAERITVAIIASNSGASWDLMEAGCRQGASELGYVDLIIKRPDPATAESQRIQLQQLLQKRVKGIAISPIDPGRQQAMLNAIAKNTLLITQNSDAPDSRRLCYIGTDHFSAGRRIGRIVAELLHNRGQIVVFAANHTSQDSIDRIRGLRTVLANTDITISHIYTDNAAAAKAVSNVVEAIAKEPNQIDCMVGLCEYNGPAILAGLSQANKTGQVKVVCFDENPKTLDGVRRGKIHATIVQQPYEVGRFCVKLLAELAKGNRDDIPTNRTIYIATKTITAENVDVFEKQLKKLYRK